jgi:hypothetical protein
MVKIHRPVYPNLSSPESTGAERQALYMFRTKIATLIGSSINADFWNYDLLQIAETYKTVQHAIAALAMAYQISILSDHAVNIDRQFVLAQYTKSINSLRQYLGKTKFRTRTQQLVVLITNILFVCLCTIQGSRSEACAHLRSGLALLHEWELGTGENKVGSAQATTTRYLVAIFTQLDTQARMMIEALGLHLCAPWDSHHVLLDGWSSGHLKPITNAFTRLEMMHNKAVQTASTCHSVQDNSRYTAFDVIEYQRELDIWDYSFVNSIGFQDDTPHFTRAIQLRRLLVGVSWGSHQTTEASDLTRNESGYKDIIDLATLITKESGFREDKITFSPAGCLVEALYFVATRCPGKPLRRQAVHLLETYPLIEGMWKSTTAAEMAAQVMADE